MCPRPVLTTYDEHLRLADKIWGSDFARKEENKMFSAMEEVTATVFSLIF